MPTILVFAPANNHSLSGHPESKERLAGLLPFLDQKGLFSELQHLPAQRASEADLRRVHSSEHLSRLASLSQSGGGNIDADTYVTRASFDSALMAAGSVNLVIDHVVSSPGNNGLALVRPPGHHASQERAEGFCLINNVAVGTRHAQANHGLNRVLIVDFDVHHGNGTQQIFYEDNSVLFASLHMYSRYFYPGTGGLGETGAGNGLGYTINIPFSPGVGDSGYLAAMTSILLPKARHFQPELIMVSAGYDAHWRDPLAAAGLSLTGYDALVRILLEMAEELCQGRIVFVLEGGYYHDALLHGVLNLGNALVGRGNVSDPLGFSPYRETDTGELLKELSRIHLRSS